MEGGRRLRRFGIARGKYLNHVPNLLPLHSAASLSQISNTISCWYCDYKIFALNNSIFHFGRRNARCLKVWFSIGVGFCLALMLGLALVLLLELGRILNVHNIYPELRKLLFGSSPTVSGLSISFADAGHVVFSTLLSVSVHEFGHAIAAASEGVQVEYIAVFIAVLFPGALVAFNFDALHALPRMSALRIYSAGVWHNAVTCAICGMALLALPVILQPFYIHGQGLMVLEVPLSSPLRTYLSPRDVIVSLDGIPIQDQQDWIRATSVFDKTSNQETYDSLHSRNIQDINSDKGYCVPRLLTEESEFLGDPSACPDDLTGFMSHPCSPLGMADYRHSEGAMSESVEPAYCLNATEIVKFGKCGDGWIHDFTNGSSCTCTQDESCLIPLQVRGSTWVEVTYITPDSPECLGIGKVFPRSEAPELVKEGNCSGTFVYVGDFSAFSDTLQLTPYRPRRGFHFGAYLPNFLEKILNCTYHVSLALALLNCLPVLYLDGESILEVNVGYCWYLSRRRRKQVVNIILFAGTSISVVAFIRMITKGKGGWLIMVVVLWISEVLHLLLPHVCILLQMIDNTSALGLVTLFRVMKEGS